jgi:hypothetical protein
MIIASACEGKSLSQGGLNMKQIVALLKNFDVVKPATREDAEKTLCDLCKSVGIAEGILQDIDFDDIRRYTYKGDPVSVTITKIAEGVAGNIFKVIIPSMDSIPFIHKKPKYEWETIEEVTVIEQYPKAFTCNNLISIKACSDGKSVIMPLALGDLNSVHGLLTEDQLNIIFDIIKEALMCLKEENIYYFDIKAGNILIGCGGQSTINIYLADLGSMLPNDDGKYITSLPWIHADSLTDPSRVNVEEYYDFQLALLYLSLHPNVPVSNPISQLPPGRYPAYWSLTSEERIEAIKTVMAYVPKDNHYYIYMKEILDDDEEDKA